LAASLSVAFGRVLRRLRTQRGLTQLRLAELTDLHPTYISLLERGHRQPTLDTLAALGKALNVSPLRLLRGTLAESNK